MHRDPRLHGLSSDHHHALVLARRLVRALAAGGTAGGALLAELDTRYRDELAPHFAVEEEILLPALLETGASELAERTLGDHARLRGLLDAAREGSVEALRDFGVTLQAHVRFEERELFPACEELLPAGVLEAVAARAPKPRARGSR